MSTPSRFAVSFARKSPASAFSAPLGGSTVVRRGAGEFASTTRAFASPLRSRCNGRNLAGGLL